MQSPDLARALETEIEHRKELEKRLEAEHQRIEAERAALLERERTARAEAEAASRSKDEFLAMLGHELRNPLAPILTALQVMQLRGVGGEREQKVIERQVRHLVRLVDDLLDISRITRGRVQLKKEPMELAVVLPKAMEMASPLYEQRSHRLSVDVPSKGLLVDADPDRLAQVIANLLTNAAKYTDPGGQIWVAARRADGQVVISVKDTGVGIPRDMLRNVFELFVQGDRTLARAQGGLGIGLALARSLVELHGGSIHARSAGPGQGSEFVARLPAYTGSLRHEDQPAGKAQAQIAQRPSSRRVLIVDDNADAAEVLADALRDCGHQTAVAHDGPAALLTARAFEPDTAILDIGLPVMDGYELARKLRELLTGPLHLIAVTGYGRDKDRAKSREAGFDVHLVKPIDLAAVIALLDEDVAGKLHREGRPRRQR